MATTQVTLSDPWQGNPPGAVLTVDEATARSLVAGGYATYTSPQVTPPAPLDLPTRVAALEAAIGASPIALQLALG